MRKETVSQKIPDNWKELSIAFSEEVQEKFRASGVNVIVCADQTFVKFLLADEKLLVPTGIRRVGTSVQSDDKRKGITLMLSAYIDEGEASEPIKCGLLPPFMVFNGKTNATLDRRYSDWGRRPGHSGSMNFQSKH